MGPFFVCNFTVELHPHDGILEDLLKGTNFEPCLLKNLLHPLMTREKCDIRD